MDKSIGILDKDYTLWVKELVKRYRGSQLKAAIKVNRELLRYYWELGKDIEEKQADNKYGTKFYATLSRDLRHEMPDVEGLSETSIRYAKRFYTLYNQQIVNLPQAVEESGRANLPQLVERLYADLFSIPWGHHRYIIDFADAGQLGGYVVACNHLLRKEGRDNPTIGLLICKQKNNTLAHNTHWNRATSPSEYPNTNLKNSIPKRWRAQCRPSGR